MIICILGRQPAIGLAELEALYGSDAMRPVGNQAAAVDADVDFKRLGGSIKAGRILTTIQGTNPQKAFLWLQKNLAGEVASTEGKLKLGVSLYGLDMTVPKLNANILSLKRALRDTGRSVRVVPNNELARASAQTYHNNLTDDRGCEIIIARDGNSMVIARATEVQAIDAYRKRDRDRPKRDTFVGMLPPKLAQTIVNLSVWSLPADGNQKTILDPFCGTGVVLQEASLMGYALYGTDISEKMIRYTKDNIDWLFERYPIKTKLLLETADATDHTWRKPIDAVACEGYLGHPFATEPTKEALHETIQTSNLIMRKFLRNLKGQIESGAPICIAMPAWYANGTVHHLPLLDDLEKLGYNRIDFVHANREDLIYRREDQVTGRELVVLTKE